MKVCLTANNLIGYMCDSNRSAQDTEYMSNVATRVTVSVEGIDYLCFALSQERYIISVVWSKNFEGENFENFCLTFILFIKNFGPSKTPRS